MAPTCDMFSMTAWPDVKHRSGMWWFGAWFRWHFLKHRHTETHPSPQ
jgi:hypothetical protein